MNKDTSLLKKPEGSATPGTGKSVEKLLLIKQLYSCAAIHIWVKNLQWYR